MDSVTDDVNSIDQPHAAAGCFIEEPPPEVVDPKTAVEPDSLAVAKPRLTGSLTRSPEALERAQSTSNRRRGSPSMVKTAIEGGILPCKDVEGVDVLVELLLDWKRRAFAAITALSLVSILNPLSETLILLLFFARIRLLKSNDRGFATCTSG